MPFFSRRRSSAIQLVLNADDLGASDKVNDAVFGLLRRGLLTSATVIANGPSVSHAIREAHSLSNCSFGVHLNITEFFPLTRNPVLAPLCDAEGRFAGNVRSVPMGRQLRSAIFEELAAQIALLKGKGLRITHLDSHHHIHTMPSLFLITKRLQRRFNIEQIRISRNLYRPGERPPAWKRAAKVLYNAFLRRCPSTIATDGFCDFATFLDLAAAGPLRHETIEVNLHPGHPMFEEETRRLEAPWRYEIPYSVEPIAFGLPLRRARGRRPAGSVFARG